MLENVVLWASSAAGSVGNTVHTFQSTTEKPPQLKPHNPIWNQANQTTQTGKNWANPTRMAEPPGGTQPSKIPNSWFMKCVADNFFVHVPAVVRISKRGRMREPMSFAR